MTKATKKDVVDAMDFLIVEWRERQNDVLGEVPFPTINYESNLFKAMGWLNLGMDYTGTVFPNSAVTKLGNAVMSRLTIPLWVLGKAQSALESHHQLIASNHQQILNANFQTIRDTFIKKISAVSATFIDSEYGRKVTDHVLGYVKDREFKDDQQMRAFLRRLIYHANLVETDPDVLRKQLNPRFGDLMQKIKYLWLASHHAPVTSRYHLKIRNNRGNNYKHIMHAELRNAAGQKVMDQIIAYAWAHDVDFVSSKKNVLVTPSIGTGMFQKPKIYEVKPFNGAAVNLYDAEVNMYMGGNQGPLTPWEMRKNQPVPQF